MTETEVIKYVQSLMKQKNMSISELSREIGYLRDTISSWFRCETHITLDGLQAILSLFGREVLVKDNAVYYRNILSHMWKLFQRDEAKTYPLFKRKRYARMNIKAWSSGKRGVKVCNLIDVFNVYGEELVIARKRNESTM